MHSEQPDHIAAVDTWLETAASQPTAQLLDLFERAVAAIWRRAQRALGEVTLTAIADRVLHVSRERHPLLSRVEVERGVVRADALRAGGPTRDEVLAAMRFLLVEWLTVLGSLTAEILTPALHAELATVTPASADDHGGGPPTRRKGPSNEGSQ
jgi:hypothetical protein